MTMHYFKALDAFVGEVSIRRGDILGAVVAKPLDVASFLPVAVELLDGPPAGDTPIRTVTAEMFRAALLDAEWFVGASETVH